MYMSVENICTIFVKAEQKCCNNVLSLFNVWSDSNLPAVRVSCKVGSNHIDIWQEDLIYKMIFFHNTCDM